MQADAAFCSGGAGPDVPRYANRIVGFFDAATSGTYRFTLATADGSLLWLDGGATLFINDAVPCASPTSLLAFAHICMVYGLRLPLWSVFDGHCTRCCSRCVGVKNARVRMVLFMHTSRAVCISTNSTAPMYIRWKTLRGLHSSEHEQSPVSRVTPTSRKTLAALCYLCG